MINCRATTTNTLIVLDRENVPNRPSTGKAQNIIENLNKKNFPICHSQNLFTISHSCHDTKMCDFCFCLLHKIIRSQGGKFIHMPRSTEWPIKVGANVSSSSKIFGACGWKHDEMPAQRALIYINMIFSYVGLEMFVFCPAVLRLISKSASTFLPHLTPLATQSSYRRWFFLSFAFWRIRTGEKRIFVA